jgi:hypothetical protein
MSVRLAVEDSFPGHYVLENALNNVPITAIERLTAARPVGGTLTFEIIRLEKPEVAAFLRSGNPGDAKPVYTVLK